MPEEYRSEKWKRKLRRIRCISVVREIRKKSKIDKEEEE
jgi:hypothetical protein